MSKQLYTIFKHTVNSCARIAFDLSVCPGGYLHVLLAHHLLGAKIENCTYGDFVYGD